jgi:hypothetical protein
MGNEHEIKPLKGANFPPVPKEAKKSVDENGLTSLLNSAPREIAPSELM